MEPVAEFWNTAPPAVTVTVFVGLLRLSPRTTPADPIVTYGDDPLVRNVVALLSVAVPPTAN